MPPIEQTEEQKKAAYAAAGVPLPATPVPAPAPAPTAPAPAPVSAVPVQQSEEQRKAAAAAAGVPLPTAGTPVLAQYTVEAGDTVDAIAKRFGVPRANVQGFRSRDPNTIFPGETLTIQSPTVPQVPQTQSLPTTPTATTTTPTQPTTPQQPTTPTQPTTSTALATQKAQEQQFFGQFGVSSQALETNFSANPFATVAALVQQVMKAQGLPDVREEITKYSKEIEDLANERDDLIAQEQDNPFVSAGTKSARAQKIEDRYEKKLANRINRLTLLQNAYKDAREQAEYVTTQAVALYDKEQTIQATSLEKALDRAEKQLESERKLKEEQGKIDYSIQDVGGRTVRFGFDQQGKQISRVDLGAATSRRGSGSEEGSTVEERKQKKEEDAAINIYGSIVDDAVKQGANPTEAVAAAAAVADASGVKLNLQVQNKLLQYAKKPKTVDFNQVRMIDNLSSMLFKK